MSGIPATQWQTQAQLGLFFKDVQLAYDGSNRLEYVGYHRKFQAPTDDLDWAIYKLSYVGSSTRLSRVQIEDGSWDNRAALF